jgi:hypothetical protein
MDELSPLSLTPLTHLNGCDSPIGEPIEELPAIGTSDKTSAAEKTDTPASCSSPLPRPAEWPTLAHEARYGLAGEILNTLEPETESDPVAILSQVLVAFGNMVGRGPHFQVEGNAHFPNLFVCLVGESSHGRKGTSFSRVMQLMKYADPEWCNGCVLAGMSSGEGLVWAVRDPIFKRHVQRHKGSVIGCQDIEVDAGVADKRLLVNESEFAQILRVMQREGNSLSPTIRQAWDTGMLRTLAKNKPGRATDAHISIAGHITRPELAKYLKYTEVLNGFANRFLWPCVRRYRLLPEGGAALDLSPLGTSLRQAMDKARQIRTMSRSTIAAALWREEYQKLSAERPGLYGAVTARAEAQVLRLSMVYALLDGSSVIDEAHLRAALGLWAYADASAKLVFATEDRTTGRNKASGKPLSGLEPDDLVGMVRAKLQQAPDGLTRTQVLDAFSRNLAADQLAKALAALQACGQACVEKERTGKPGAPAERWRAVRTNESIADPGQPDVG